MDGSKYHRNYYYIWITADSVLHIWLLYIEYGIYHTTPDIPWTSGRYCHVFIRMSFKALNVIRSTCIF